MADWGFEVKRFLIDKVNTKLKWDIVRFFHHNPYLIDTLENIALYVGWQQVSVQDALDELAQNGILEIQDVAGLKAYTLSTSDQTLALIDQLTKKLQGERNIEDVIRSIRQGEAE
jgi:hypothetical protein